jgi:hypothetical protein
MSAFRDWWYCRGRIRALEAELVRAGVHRTDPMYPLIREMATLPDRLIRWVLMLLLVCITSGGVLAMMSRGGEGIDGLIVLPGSTKTSVVYVISAPNGSRWVPCPPSPGKICLEVFTQSTTKGKS